MAATMAQTTPSLCLSPSGFLAQPSPSCICRVTAHGVAVSGSWDVVCIFLLTHLPRMAPIVAMHPAVVSVFVPLHIWWTRSQARVGIHRRTLLLVACPARPRLLVSSPTTAAIATVASSSMLSVAIHLAGVAQLLWLLPLLLVLDG